MAVLTDYLSRRGEVLVLVLVVVVSITLMLLSQAEKDAVVRLVNDTALTPIQIVLTRGRSLTGLRAENDSLRTALVRRSLEVARLRDDAQEADRLRGMLGFRDRTDLDVVPATVIAREASRRGRDLKIDRGARDGVRRNLAVVTVDGLLGKVIAAEPRSSFVRPLLAPGCRVSARLSRTRTDGILEWSHDRGLQLSFLPLRVEIRVGDEIVTSGLGGVFPPGIPVGRVSETEIIRADGSLRVLIEPITNFHSLEEVFVVVAAPAAGVGGAGDGDAASRIDPGFAPPAPAAGDSLSDAADGAAGGGSP